jgi:outer membrane lipoprotein-sorting protein
MEMSEGTSAANRYGRATPADRTALGLLAVLLCVATASMAVPQTTNQRARDIVDRVDRMLRGDSSVGTMTMEIQSTHWTRTLVTKVWSKGTDRALILVLEPAKEAGTATLKAADNIWNYLPKVERVIKIPTSMMMGSWMGSHFTNDDLVKESRLIRDYAITISFEGERAGTLVWEFVLTPHPDAAVVWGKILLEVRQQDLMPTWQRYYDEHGNLVRTLTFGDYRQMGGRLIPARMEMRPADKPNEYTVITYRDLAFDVALDDDFFSLRNLRTVARISDEAPAQAGTATPSEARHSAQQGDK